jgi:hypothetical protein
MRVSTDLYLERYFRDTYVHEDRDDHELSVEAYKRLIFLEAMLLDESLLDSSKEVPVKASIDKKDKNLGYTIPDLIDAHKAAIISINLFKFSINDLRLADRRNGMGGDPDSKDSNVDESDS